MKITVLGGGPAALMAGASLAWQGHQVTCITLLPAAKAQPPAALPRVVGADGHPCGYLAFSANPAALSRSQRILVTLDAPTEPVAGCTATLSQAARLIGQHVFSDVDIALPEQVSELDLRLFRDNIADILAYRDLWLRFSVCREAHGETPPAFDIGSPQPGLAVWQTPPVQLTPRSRYPV